MAKMPPETITCPVARNARRDPNGAALRCAGATLSHADLDARVCAWIHKLRGAGVESGDRIAVLAHNSPAFATLVFAACRLGAVLVPLNVRLDPASWRESLARANGKLLCVEPSWLDFAASTGLVFHRLDEGNDGDSPALAAAAAEGDTCEIRLAREATIIFTSGSAGIPKGVILTAGNHYHAALAANENLPLERTDCWLAVLPFYHVGGLAILFRAALAGCCVQVLDGFDAGEVRRLIDEGLVSHVSLVPAMLRDLLATGAGERFPPSLKAILLGGGPVRDRLADDITSRGLPVLTTYGMTETASQICTASPGDPAAKRRSAGRPLKRIEVAIVDTDGRQLGPGREGEIWVRGKPVSRGYLGEDEGQTRGPGDWLRTGDLGHRDEEGYLYVAGRRDDMFVSGGENIYPAVIERIAARFPGVRECAVVAVPSARWGKRPVLFVRPDVDAELSISKLQAYLANHLARIFLPAAIIKLGEFPRTAAGKIDRRRLRQRHLTGGQQQ